jgi:hypothetical protein
VAVKIRRYFQQAPEESVRPFLYSDIRTLNNPGYSVPVRSMMENITPLIEGERSAFESKIKGRQERPSFYELIVSSDSIPTF